MYLDLEPYVQSIREKIANNDLSFTENEKLVLKSRSDLRQQIFNLMIDANFFNEDAIEGVDFTAEMQPLLPDERFWLAYLNTFLESKGLISIDGLSGILGDSSPVLDYFFNYIEQNRNTIKINESLGLETLELLVDRGYLDIVCRVRSVYEIENISDNILHKIRDYIESSGVLAPRWLLSVKDHGGVNYSQFALSDMIYLFGNTGITDEQKAQDYEAICKKIAQGNFDGANFGEIDFTRLLNYDINNKKMLIERIIKHLGLLNDSLLSEFSDDDINYYEELIVNGISASTEFKFHCDFNNWLSRGKFVEKLIQTGHIGVAVKSPIFYEYMEDVISKIEKGEITGPFEVDDSWLKYPSLIKLLNSKKMISSCNFYEIDQFKLIIELINSGVIVELNELFYNHSDIIEACIRAKNFSGLFDKDLNTQSNVSISPECTLILLEHLKSDFKLAEHLVKKVKPLIFHNEDILEFYLRSDIYFSSMVIETINHNVNLHHFYNDKVYMLIREKYARKYSLNIMHLDVLKDKFGARIIRYLDNANIHQLANLSDAEFNKFLQLFPDVSFNMNDANTIYDSIMQYKFSKIHPEVISIFANIMHFLDENNLDYTKCLEDLYSKLDETFYARLEKAINEWASDWLKKNATGDNTTIQVEYEKMLTAALSWLERLKIDPKRELLSLAEQIQNNLEHSEISKVYLHFITNCYIAVKREEYRDTYNIGQDLSLPYDLDKNDVDKKIFRYILQSEYWRGDIEKYLTDNGINLMLAKACISYYLGESINCDLNSLQIAEPVDCSLKNIQKNMKNMVKLVKAFILEQVRQQVIADMFDKKGEVKRVYKIPHYQPDFYALIGNLNVNALRNLFKPDNSTAYESLLQVMHKYKLHQLPDMFKQLLERKPVSISGDYSNLAAFISYYDKIFESEKTRRESQSKDASRIVLSPIKIFKEAETYSSVSSCYSQVLGDKDSKLIKSNPGPNEASAKTSGNTRLDENVELTVNNFRRAKVTIPTFTGDIKLQSGKTMYVSVGNFTHSSNVTHGERTGACMRVGGVGESLFYFCLKDENGFHIRFENPETGEYISRVSGFRNGNTVFLNELRYSCNQDDYNNDEVVEACREVAKILIEMSKDSSCPIQNVVVHKAYAVESSKYSSINLGISDNKVGLPYFYSDVGTTVHILATTAATTPFVPIDFDKSKVPTYLPAREKAKATADIVEFSGLANRIVGVKMLLDGRELGEVEPMMIDDNFVYGIASQDWYVYVGADCIVHEGIIGIDSRAKEELATARKIIEEMVPRIEKEQLYQY